MWANARTEKELASSAQQWFVSAAPKIGGNFGILWSERPEFAMNTDISEAQINALVEAFYAKARQDPEIGPIFNAVVDDWPRHLAALKDFWSTVLLATGRYKGNPMIRHFQLGLDPQHFERWLDLFAETVHGIFPPDTAAVIVEKSRRIAQSLQEVSANAGARAAGA